MKAKARAVLIGGKVYEKKTDGSLVPYRDKTDWDRLDRMTDAEATQLAQSDPDASPMTDAEWAAARVVNPIKVPVGLKLDDDMLNWFKAQGRGYQTRINTVLRKYYEAHRANRKAG